MRILFIFTALTKDIMNNPYFYSRLFVFSALILLLQACWKNDSNDSNDTAEFVLKEVYHNDELKNRYEYNDAWQLIKTTNIERTGSRTANYIYESYFYNNDGRLGRTEFTNTSLPPANQPATIEYTYNNQGRLTASKALKRTGDLLTLDEYDYNAQTITVTNSTSTGVSYVTTYTVDGLGNIVKAVTDDQTSGNNDYTEEWQNFDDKKNVGGSRVGDVSSKNNPRRYILYAPQRSTEERLMGYTYNGAGYVTSRKDYNPNYEQINITKFVLSPKQ
jgi:hypothetical protein